MLWGLCWPLFYELEQMEKLVAQRSPKNQLFAEGYAILSATLNPFVQFLMDNSTTFIWKIQIIFFAEIIDSGMVLD